DRAVGPAVDGAGVIAMHQRAGARADVALVAGVRWAEQDRDAAVGQRPVRVGLPPRAVVGLVGHRPQLLVDVVLLVVGEEESKGTGPVGQRATRCVDSVLGQVAGERVIDVRFAALVAGRQNALGALVVVGGEAQLLEVVLALGARGSLAHLLNCRQEQADQDRNDRDHHEEFDQGERGRSTFEHGGAPGKEMERKWYRTRNNTLRRGRKRPILMAALARLSPGSDVESKPKNEEGAGTVAQKPS